MIQIPLGATAAGAPQAIAAAMANRHGLIAGATGTGKTVTLQTLAEGFSRAGVPVFLADVKGDLSGLARAAEPGEKILARIAQLGITDYRPGANPTVFWDIDGQRGHAVRATVAEFGPLLLANLMELNDTQTGVLYAAFKITKPNVRLGEKDTIGHRRLFSASLCASSVRALFTASTAAITPSRRQRGVTAGSAMSVEVSAPGPPAPVVSMTTRRKGETSPLDSRASRSENVSIRSPLTVQQRHPLFKRTRFSVERLTRR